MQTSAEQVPSLHWVAPRYLKLVTSFLLADKASICIDVVRAVGRNLALFCADFHLICRWSVYECVGEILKLIIATAHKWAIRRLHLGIPTVEMYVWWSGSVFSMIFSRNKFNRMGESKHP